MADYFKGDVFVTLETPDGTVRKFKAVTASLSVQQDFIDVREFGSLISKVPTYQRTKFEFESIGEFITTQDEIKNTVKKFNQTNEWQCLYCGTPNDKHIKNCYKCGAPRNFIYAD